MHVVGVFPITMSRARVLLSCHGRYYIAGVENRALVFVHEVSRQAAAEWLASFCDEEAYIAEFGEFRFTVTLSNGERIWRRRYKVLKDAAAFIAEGSREGWSVTVEERKRER